MNIVMDIGNSWTKVGRPSGSGTWKVERVKTEHVAAHAAVLGSESVALASVVPSASQAVRDAVEVPVFEVSHRVRLPFEMGYQTPGTLGNDRIAAAAGALLAYGEEGRPVFVIDAGTAVTYEVVDARRIYRGGAIAPGPGLMAQALHLGTAQLPGIEEPLEGTAVGASTEEALRSGVFWGFVDAVSGMIDRLHREIGPGTTVLTGGWSSFLAAHVRSVDIVDPHLVLVGIETLRRMNA